MYPAQRIVTRCVVCLDVLFRYRAAQKKETFPSFPRFFWATLCMCVVFSDALLQY